MTNTYPLSPFKKVGNLLFISGQIGQKDGKLVSDDLKEQINQTVQNIKNILEQNNLNIKDVVDVTVFLVDQDDYADLNDEYAKLFEQPYPTRTTVTVKSLPLNAKIEIKAIAQIK
jgi:2-iminobutanoate/2-iminopropanoate deaminase